jgi:hypothetical protein
MMKELRIDYREMMEWDRFFIRIHINQKLHKAGFDLDKPIKTYEDMESNQKVFLQPE